MEQMLRGCTMCPHRCRVNRFEKVGRCKAGANVKVALVNTHDYEEPPISGKNGSGTIFFVGCNLSCVYCQNHEISQKMYGKEITVERLADIMLEQQKRGVHNINLVTPTIYAYQIKEAIKLARKKGLNIPIVYNTSGYESVETLKALEGYIDIYLPDFKYFDDNLGEKYSNIKEYSKYVKEALIEMRRQTKDTFNKNGLDANPPSFLGTDGKLRFLENVAELSWKDVVIAICSVLVLLGIVTKKDVKDFMNLEVELGILKKPISDDKLYWEGSK